MSVHTIYANAAQQPYLVVTAGEVHCALPLSGVAEISRPPQGDLPTSIVLRGREMRLFDLPTILGVDIAARTRIIRLCLQHDREAALAVSTVPGARLFDPETFTPIRIAPGSGQTPYPDAIQTYGDILALLRAGGCVGEFAPASSENKGNN
ncbi:MAG: chemotaxis protein CheW [Acidobacteria bacterium]|nr:chemotaxis protein CheW [Acidobacteriota bacterium]